MPSSWRAFHSPKRNIHGDKTPTPYIPVRNLQHAAGLESTGDAGGLPYRLDPGLIYRHTSREQQETVACVQMLGSIVLRMLRKSHKPITSATQIKISHRYGLTSATKVSSVYETQGIKQGIRDEGWGLNLGIFFGCALI